MMDFSNSSDMKAIEEGVEELCADFGYDYWLDLDKSGAFPCDFHAAMARGGWLGICMPPEYGGSGLGISEASVMMRTVAASGAGMSGASAIHMNIFGLHPVVRFGTEEQKARILPPIISGESKACFAVTEPNTGLDTTKLKTQAVRRGDKYIVNGQKVWISTAQVADKMLIIARTKPIAETKRPIDGLSLFYTDLDRSRVSVREIEKMGRKCVDSNELFIEDLEIPAENLIGQEGDGFRYLLHGLNPERVLAAASAVGLGKAALGKAAHYASERVVFDRPIGQNQGIQHPLAQRWAELEAADLLMMRAAWEYDNGGNDGPYANAAKFICAETGFRACETAVLTFGGFGYAKEYHVERLFRESMLVRIAPISAQMILCYIAERVLGLPKSY